MKKFLHVLVVREQIATFFFASPRHFAEKYTGMSKLRALTCALRKDSQILISALRARFLQFLAVLSHQCGF